MGALTLGDVGKIISRRSAGKRTLTAIAGPPASGKSTAAEALAATFNRADPRSAAVVPMDGFHYDDRVLIHKGLKAKKGAPETFDVGGFSVLLTRLKANEEQEIAIPVFDRDLEIARAGARIIGRSVRHIIVEGNYLLLDRDPWRNLTRLFDTTIAIASSLPLLRARLEARWTGYGLVESDIVRRIEENDLPNARLVMSTSAEPQFWLTSEF